MIDKTVCELFAGVGGFRLGLESSSNEWNTVWANQWEPGKKVQHAYECYCHHFGQNENHVNEDIASIDKSLIPDHNLLVGGFPCQDYSVARTGAKGISGVKGVLWWEIRDILEAKSPRFVILENVDRLLKSPSTQRGRDFGIILACFNSLGYSLEWRVINAADYGFPQRRRRTFIFAYKNSTSYSSHIANTTGQCIINNVGFFAKAFPLEPTAVFSTTELLYNNIADVSDNFKYDFGNSGYMTNGHITTCTAKPIAEESITIRQLLDEHVDNRFLLQENVEKWAYLKGAKKIERKSKTGHEYTFSEGPISFPDSIDKPARTILTSESSLNRSTHVIEDPNSRRLRLLTPLEAERIQGFHDNWTDTGMPEKFRYFCMGNALVVGVVRRIGNTLNIIFSKEESEIGTENKESKVI